MSFPIVQACVYQRIAPTLFRNQQANSSDGIELTRRVEIEPTGLGLQIFRVTIEQNDVDEATVKVIKRKGQFQVVDVGVDRIRETFEDKVNRSERGAKLFTRSKELAREKFEAKLQFSRLVNQEQLCRAFQSAVRRECFYGYSLGSAFHFSITEQLIYTDELGSGFARQLATQKSEVEASLIKLDGEIAKVEEELKDFQRSRHIHNADLSTLTGEQSDPVQAYNQFLGVIQAKNHSLDQSVIEINLDVTELSPIAFDLKYATGGGWIPRYEVKVSSKDLTQVEIFYYSVINQSTCEDWHSVELTVCTGEMTTSGSPPYFGTCVVRHLVPKVVMAPRAPKKMLFGAMRHGPTAEAVDDSEAAAYTLCSAGADAPKAELMSAVPVDGSALQAAYKLPEKVSVPSDSQSPSRFLIGRVQMPIRTLYYCCPENDPHVYRACRLRNQSEYYFAASNGCSIFWDGSYVSNTKMPCVAPGDTFNLFLGQSERIKVKVQPPKHRFKNGGGLLGQNDKLFYERHVTVENFEPNQIQLFVAFNLIESQDDLIKINLDKISNATEISATDDISIVDSPKYPTDTNKKLTWIFNPVTRNCIALVTLGPQSKESFVFATVIESPNGRVLRIQPIE